MRELALESGPDIPAAAREAAGGQVVFLTEHGERLAAIVPAAFAAELEHFTSEQLRELFEDFADGAVARAARASIEAGEPLIPWDQVKIEAGL